MIFIQVKANYLFNEISFIQKIAFSKLIVFVNFSLTRFAEVVIPIKKKLCYRNAESLSKKKLHI